MENETMRTFSLTDLVEEQIVLPKPSQWLFNLRDRDEVLIYRNQTFDSSRFGETVLLIVGPKRTFTLESAPEWLGDQPSERKQCLGRLDIEELRAADRKSGREGEATKGHVHVSNGS